MRDSLSIWFFSGILLLAYGLLIAGTGIWELFGHAPTPLPVLYQLHPAIWWGGMMTAFGLLYTVKFRPR
jgi:hypothetical protein